MADTGFIRFRDVTIPENSRIISAVVIFTGFEAVSGIGTDLLCYFEDVDSPAAPTDKSDLDSRSLTSAVNWYNVEEWFDNHVYQTPQLASILQTVINRSGWASGNDVLFLAVDNNSDSYRLWSAFEYRGGLEKAALRVSWIEPVQIDTPLIEPVEEFQLAGFGCSIRTYPTDASIYYTTDGSTPDETDTLYSTPFQVSTNTVVKARAYKQYWTDSAVATRSYTIYAGDNFDISVNQTYIRYGVTGAAFPYLGDKLEYSGFITFKNVTIPQGVSINSAYLRVFNPDHDRSDPVLTYLKFNLVDSAIAPVNGNEYLSKIGNTTDGTAWNQTTEVEADTWYNSVDISSELQDIINRGGWESGNAVLLFLDCSHYSWPHDAVIRVAEQRASSSVQRYPELHVSWEGGSGIFYAPVYTDDGEFGRVHN